MAPAGAHRTADPPARQRVGFSAADIDAALAALDQTFDIDRGDLDRIFREVETQALLRTRGELRCDQIMSRDVIGIAPDATPEDARLLLLRHNIRTLPVLEGTGRLLGVVGLRELAGQGERVADLLSAAAVARPSDPALGLLPALTDGRAHAVVIAEPDGQVLGLITQTDLLAAVASMLRR
jgi:CBS domain-containing membrane protein